MNRFLTENSPKFRMLRTIVQGVLAVLSTNVVEIVSHINIPAFWQSIIVMIVMAILAPVMAAIGDAIAVSDEEVQKRKEQADGYIGDRFYTGANGDELIEDTEDCDFEEADEEVEDCDE